MLAVTAPALVGAGAAADKVTRLDLGFDTSTPGTEVTVPILLEVPEGIEVGRTISEIAFPKKILSFQKADAHLDAQVETEVTPDPKNADLSILKVTVTRTAGGLRTGTVASVVFQAARDAPVAEPIKLRNVPRAFTPGSQPRPIVPIEGREGEIQLTATAPATTCFFYMH